MNLSGYRLMVTEEPTMKMRENKGGEMEPATDRDGVAKFVVMLFAKPRPRPGERTGRGEEIKVTLACDPGEGFTEGSYVELVNPVLNTYEMRGEDGQITGSGVWFKADGLKPVGASLDSAA